MATRKRAFITPLQGIEVIRQMLRDIDDDSQLQQSVFGSSVHKSLVSMAARLTDGAFFSHRMEVALENWNIAIHRDQDGEAQEKSGRLM